MSDRWTMFKATKETPCCHQSVRVKIVEPGIQNRKCQLCGEVNVFTLEPIGTNKLRLRWLTDDEVEALDDVEGPDIQEL